MAEELIELGRPKGEKWFPKDIDLGGWSKRASTAKRRSILKGLLKRRSCRRVLGAANAIANVTQDAETKRKLRADYKWLRSQGACKLKSKD